MLKAFILIETADGKARGLVKSLRNRNTLGQVDQVAGSYEVIAVLETEDMRTLSDLVDREVLHHEEVRRVEICIGEPPARAAAKHEEIEAVTVAAA
jgi:DNA-binding Lrp family transcriptional regulator